MSHGEFVGSLTFHEVIQAVARNGGAIGDTVARTVMDDFPLTCTPKTELDKIRRMMLQRHARYLPVMDQHTLMGVISFYDVARAGSCWWCARIGASKAAGGPPAALRCSGLRCAQAALALQAAPGQRPGRSPGTNGPLDRLCPGLACSVSWPVA